jgi:predicted HicB family RNase H-like nuclease
LIDCNHDNGMGTKKVKEATPMLKPTMVRLPPDLLRRAKIAAVERDTSLQQLVTEALDAFLRKGGRS